MTQKTVSVKTPFEMPAITCPEIPEKDFVISDFGAEEGGVKKCTKSIEQAIRTCSQAGGGRVIVPAGLWLSGAIHLKSRVNLHLLEGAELLFSDDRDDYLPAVYSSWEGWECMNYSPLIYAYECTDVALTGKGTIRSKMDGWEKWTKRDKAHMNQLIELYEMGSKGTPIQHRDMTANPQVCLRPQLLQLNRCERILIEGLKIRNSPFWTVHPYLCSDVVIRNLDIQCRGGNSDGMDLEYCDRVLVEECCFDQDDDPICVKSGRNQDGWRIGKPSQNIVIRNCVVTRGHNLFVIGSELSGGARNIYVHDCEYRVTEGWQVSLIFIKTNERRGGVVENVFVENIRGGSVPIAAVDIDTDVLFQWKDIVKTHERRLTKIRNIQVSNVELEEADFVLKIKGEPECPVIDVRLQNVGVRKIRESEQILNHAKNVRIDGKDIC